MTTNDVDDLVLFHDVRVLGSTAPALLCQIGDKTVWLPRLHISGRLWCTGDRGELSIRRWVARDRRLTVAGASTSSIPPRRLPIPFDVARRERSPGNAG